MVQVFTSMLGATIDAIVGGEVGSEDMRFAASDGRQFRFYHSQDCCENVGINEIYGDLADLLGSPIVQAEEVSSEGTPNPDAADSFTWTFYKFSTVRGSVTVRWLGESNGYYSESVDFEESK